MSYWHRVEPNSIDTDVEEGIQARIADPLWLLARQWQVGEFKGEDAASPVQVRVRGSSSKVETFRNEAAEGAAVEPFASKQPLECRVEAESVLDGPAAVALAAEAGVQFLRRLELAGLGEVRRQAGWRTEYGFDHAGDGLDTTRLPERTQRRLALLERRGLDGRKLFAAPEGEVVRGQPAATRGPVAAVLRAWRTEYQGRLRAPGPSGDCWIDERLEYGFSVAARTDGGEVVLKADGYHGGHLDWDAFRVDARTTHGLGARAARPRTMHLLPQPATFRSQGAPRWWEFEDRAVYFGNLSAGPADVARLVVAEYATVFSDDWFVIPWVVATGTLTRVTALEVFDVFGGRTSVQSAAVLDAELSGPQRPWRYFELEGDTSADAGLAPWLFVPPALADSLHGKPVERVTFVRDEGANLGWAIEQEIELPTGEPMLRRMQWSRSEGAVNASGALELEASEAWRYRLQSSVPPWWVPLVPEATGVGAEMRLRRARLQSWADVDPALAGAKGRIVGVPRALRIFEEEVPRGGVQVTRAWQRARAADGSVHVWMARLKRPGRGDRGSGLEFDVIER